MFELWISEPWDANPRVLRGCLRPLRSMHLGLFTAETGEYLLRTRYVGDSILSVYSDIPITVNMDKLVRPYAEVWSVIENLPAANPETQRTPSILEPFGIGTLVLSTGWTVLAFVEAYEQALKGVATSLRLEPPRKICEASALLIYQRCNLALVAKMVRYDLSVSCFLTQVDPRSAWYGLSVEHLFLEDLLTPEESSAWHGILDEHNNRWRDTLSEEFHLRIRKRDVEAVQQYFRYNAERDAFLLSKYGSAILMRAMNSLNLPAEENG